jgi:iron-sulfur cluster insertion protein
MIKITDNARAKITELLAEENQPYIRLFVQGGGCAGFSYGFAFDSESQEDDFEVWRLLVDSMSAQYLQDAEVDWKEDLTGSQFVVNNPNANSTCGCGSSFGVAY